MQLPQDEKHPILAGLIALVAVTFAVGLVLGIVAIVGTHVFGVGGDGGSTSAGQTLYLPTPSPTPTPDSPLVTLAPSTQSAEPTEAPQETASPSESPSPKAKQITLSSGETSVAPMQQIDLTGVYPGGEGAILQVQR